MDILFRQKMNKETMALNNIPVFPTPLVKEVVFFLLYILASFVEDKVTIGSWIYLWAFYSVPFYISVFVPVFICFIWHKYWFLDFYFLWIPFPIPFQSQCDFRSKASFQEATYIWVFFNIHSGILKYLLISVYWLPFF